MVITDDEIDALSEAERRELIGRLARPISESGLSPERVARARRVRLALMVLSAIALVPWIGYLAWTLPHTYRAENWDATWIGFDTLMLALIVTTVVLGWQRRLAVVATAFATGVVLACDAWFDVMTARDGDRAPSIIAAVVIELPLAVLLISGGLRMMRLTAERLWILEPGQSVLQIRIPLPRREGISLRRPPG